LRSWRKRSPVVIALVAIVVLAALGTGTRRDSGPAAAVEAAPVGIDLLVTDGDPTPLSLVPGVRYRIDEIDLIATDSRPEDDALHGLITQSVFAPLDWEGLALAFSDTVQGLDGQRFMREIHRDAAWMTGAHRFKVTLRGADGTPIGSPIKLVSDVDRREIPTDDFPIRRPAVIREHRSGVYYSEALLQLRNGLAAPAGPDHTFLMTEAIRRVDLAWEAPGGSGPVLIPGAIPVTAVTNPPFAYGFRMDLALEGAPRATYEPGQVAEIVITFRDGAGNRLHPPGSLPTYNQFRHGLASGLRYYDFYPSVLYFKDKNKEGVMLFAFYGPVERARQVYYEVSAAQFALEQQVVATPRRDGYSCIWQGVPPSNVLFAGLADSTAWDTPIADRIRFTIPTDAQPGHYRIVGKGRRSFNGESSLVTGMVDLEVLPPSPFGSSAPIPDAPAAPPSAPRPGALLKDETGFASCPAPGEERTGLDGGQAPWVGKCKDCHAESFQLGGLLHGNGDPTTCDACHAPLAFEPDNMLVYRVHYLHFFSRRYQGGDKNCAACHYGPESVARVSRLACLSCHVTYHGGADEYGNYRSCAFSKCHDGVHDQF